MQVLAFRVRNFRSVEDSGWVNIDRVTALIGTNESGKTNLLLPLWKLNPANDGQIDPIADYPRKKYNAIRIEKEKPVFISARFSVDPDLALTLSGMGGTPAEQLDEVVVEMDYDSNYYFDFPNVKLVRSVPAVDVSASLTRTLEDIEAATAIKGEEALKAEVLDKLAICIGGISKQEFLDQNEVRGLIGAIPVANLELASRRSVIVPRLGQLNESLSAVLASISLPDPGSDEKVQDLVLERLPHFVYYSNYGNLDSEIYLPHVIDNLKRQGLGSKEEAKARTLRVLFDFVKLKPTEIQALGADVVAEDQDEGPTDEEISAIARKKKERDVLLQSAGNELTSRFREWWKQGDYRFRFQADGDHFRIWVSDDKRPEDIELENRSTGLQWFLSFFLIFLVESLDAHKDSVLLLDEPGLSLHPLAQEDLSKFFDGLSASNQLIYTTHSPFLVDADRLERVKAVYVGADGTTRISADLKAADQKTPESRSIYPVFAALGLSVSRTLFLGCKAVIVEGPSDQFYLSAIKTMLIGKGLIKPAKEILFIPAGGVRGVKAVMSVVMGLDEEFPPVVLDSDQAGVEFRKSLLGSLYKGQEPRIVMIGSFSSVKHDAEIEDLFPPSLIAKTVDRQLRANVEEDFSDSLKAGLAIVPQIEEFAHRHKIVLSDGWKVDVARTIRQRLTKEDLIDAELLEVWRTLFETMGA